MNTHLQPEYTITHAAPEIPAKPEYFAHGKDCRVLVLDLDCDRDAAVAAWSYAYALDKSTDDAIYRGRKPFHQNPTALAEEIRTMVRNNWDINRLGLKEPWEENDE